MYSKFSEQARKVLILAKKSALNLDDDFIEARHLLLGLVKEKEGLAHKILAENGITEEKILEKIHSKSGPKKQDGYAGIGLTPRSERILRVTIAEAKRRGYNSIDTEHILLGLIQAGQKKLLQIISEAGGNLDKIKNELTKRLQNRNNQIIQGKINKTKTRWLDKFSRDLTEQARNNRLDPVIGRNKEIERIIQILSRRTKNNPVLIGNAGVGKTAIVEGLARRIKKGKVFDLMFDKRLVALDLGSIVAGTKYRGEFERKMKAVINDIVNNDNIILFIDELHTIIGAGGAQGSIDAANMLKPGLASGQLQVIGATTIDDYRNYIETDSALQRRFQTVLVEENTPLETIEILKGLKYYYEAHHQVKITEQAIEAAVNLSDRYIPDRFLPDKALDLIDEAGAKVRLKRSKKAPVANNLSQKLKKIMKEKTTALKNEEYEKAADLKDIENKIENKIEYIIDKNEDTKKENNMPEVKEEDIAEIVSSWTKIPLTTLKETEIEKILHLEEKLHERIIGQKKAVTAVSRAIRRDKAGLKNPDLPQGSFVFLGPSGVGKTELAKTLAEVVFGSEETMVRIDMSEYMEKHAVSRLVGSPPGYVGHEKGGQLIEPIRRHPYSIVLFDEIEKAHPEVFNILLQVLEEGVLTDTHGRKVDFKNTIIIMTSNVGSDLIKKQSQIGFKRTNKIKENVKEEYEVMKEKLIDEFKNTFRPEFINRLDEIIVFHALNKKHLKQIIDLMLAEIKERLRKKEIEIEITSGVKDKIVEEGFQPQLGARGLRSAIQKQIENPLSKRILEKSINYGDTIKVRKKVKKIVFKKIN